jgi:outer membrane protein assembly factor BamB
VARRGSPVIGGGRIWSLDAGAGLLQALDPKTGQSRGQVSVGATTRFATPAIYGRNVYIPTLAGATVVATS